MRSDSWRNCSFRLHTRFSSSGCMKTKHLPCSWSFLKQPAKVMLPWLTTLEKTMRSDSWSRSTRRLATSVAQSLPEADAPTIKVFKRPAARSHRHSDWTIPNAVFILPGGPIHANFAKAATIEWAACPSAGRPDPTASREMQSANTSGHIWRRVTAFWCWRGSIVESSRSNWF